ncbi:MAG: beta strand repeat-containing protein, partial [Leptothrix ochracea]|uniref:beta strand repeat-containing protein n=1 Tax=Leptothrix ochracea TaxID=735331 RepID=UPI0034E2DA8A
LLDGNHTVVVTQTDLAGNVSPISTTNFKLDTTVAQLFLALANDNGVSATDHQTSVGTLKLVDALGAQVAPEVGAVVEYSVDGGTTWSTTFTPISGGTFDPAGLITNNSVMVRQIDVAGNISTASPVFSFNLLGAGNPPLVSALDTGSLDAPTAITNTATINVTPGITLPAGTTAIDYAYSLDNGVTWTSALAVPVTGGTITIPGLADGNHSAMVHAIDPVSGIATADAQVSFVLDTAITAVTAALTVDSFKAINDPLGLGATDTITNDGRLTISNVDPNLDSITVTYTRTDALGVVSTQTVTAPALAVADPLVAGQFLTTIAAPTLGDGAYSASIVQTDKAGNTTTATPFTATFTLDTTLALPLVTLTTDTANPANPATALDGITNLSNLLVANVEPGASVDFTVTNAAGGVVGLANNTVAVDPLTNTAAILAAINTGVGGSPDGAYTITVTQTDVAGNQKSQALPLVIDTAISTLTAVLATDTASALNPAGTTGDKISQVGDVVIGSLDLHVDSVSYTFTRVDANGVVLTVDPVTGLALTPLTGSFVPTAGATSATLSAVTLGLVNGHYDLAVDQIDKAGNSTAANLTTTHLAFTYDTVALPPVIAPTTDSALLGYTGVYGSLTAPFTPTLGTDLNKVTNVSDLTLSGLEVGAAVTYTITNTLTGAVVVPSTAIPAANIDPVTLSTAVINPIATNVPGVNDGTYAVTVTQTDLAGNTNTATSSYTIDTVINPLTGSVSLNGVAPPVPDGITIYDRVGALG